MGDLQDIGGIEKVKSNNYITWTTCMMFYLKGQDFWKVVGKSKIITPLEENANRPCL